MASKEWPLRPISQDPGEMEALRGKTMRGTYGCLEDILVSVHFISMTCGNLMLLPINGHGCMAIIQETQRVFMEQEELVARHRSVTWTDATGNFWLMGGLGYDGAGNLGELNDLWMFSPLTGNWTWVKGDETINNSGVYGTKNVPNSLNKPGARYGATAFKDGAGNLWLYGGFGFGESGEDRLSDLWKISSPALSALPVHLVEFKGRLVNDNGVLNWKTENEENLSSYIVERSIDRKNYVPVGTVVADNTSGRHQYNFSDPNIASLGTSVVYYRLRQKDFDGKSTYSSIIALTIDNSLLVMLYPNPVIKSANITITVSRAEIVNVKVINEGGAVVKQVQWKLVPGSTSETLDLSVLSKGTYYLEISGETISKKVPFVRQ
jgi:hypothetical protein